MKAKSIGELMRFATIIAVLLAAMDIPAAKAQVSQQGDMQGMVVIKEIVFSGNTVIDTDVLQKVVEPFKNRELTLEEMSEMADLVTMTYQEKGYILARAYLPEQEIKDGILKIAIAEGKIGKIKVTGKTHFQDRVIKRYFNQQLDHGIVKESLLEKGLLLSKEMPEIGTEVILKGGEETGTVDIILDTEDSSVLTFTTHLSADYNNFGSETIGVDRWGTAIELVDNNWGSRLKLRGVVGRNVDDSALGFGNLSIPINSHGTRTGATYLESTYTVGQELTDLGLEGRTSVYGGDISHPIIKKKNMELKFTLGYDHKYSKSFLLEDVSSTDVLDVWYAYLDFDNLDRFLGKNIISLQFFSGRIDPNNDPKNQNSRDDADPYFEKIKLGLTRIQRIFGYTNIILRAAGQYTHYKLLPVEQAILGGYGNVRGHEPATFLGDSGYNVSAELVFAPPFIAEKNLFGQRVSQLVQFALFYDHGGVFINDPEAGNIDSEFLGGYGGGFRLFYKDFTFKYDIGFPIEEFEDKDDFVHYFMVSYQFF